MISQLLSLVIERTRVNRNDDNSLLDPFRWPSSDSRLSDITSSFRVVLFDLNTPKLKQANVRKNLIAQNIFKQF